jgi:hypothetical protein
MPSFILPHLSLGAISLRCVANEPDKVKQLPVNYRAAMDRTPRSNRINTPGTDPGSSWPAAAPWFARRFTRIRVWST